MQTRYIHFVKFSGQAAQTVAFMAFCIETQTLKVILAVFYPILTSEILPAGAGQGEEDFLQKTRMCKFGVIAFCIGALHFLLRQYAGQLEHVCTI